MSKISDQIAGLSFAEKVVGGALTLQALRSQFQALKPVAKTSAIVALKDSGDPLLVTLAKGLDAATTPATYRGTTDSQPYHYGESARDGGGEGARGGSGESARGSSSGGEGANVGRSG